MVQTLERRRHKGRIAAIDLGSNSAHLVIAEADSSGSFRVLDSEKILLRLAQALDEKGNFTEAGMEAAVSAFRQMKEIASSYTEQIRAVATFATREAKNHSVLLKRIHKATGITIEVIDGLEEARLEFLGAQQGLPLHGRRCLLVDIGGGSTEVMIADGDSAEFGFVVSARLGAVTFTNRYLQGRKQKKSAFDAMQKAISTQVNLLPKAPKLSFDWAIASSGTAKALATICARFFQNDELSDPNGYVFSVDHLSTLCTEFLRLGDAKRIRAQFGVDLKRAEILLAGSAILLGVSRRLGVKQWIVSTYSLREGLVVDSFRRLGREVNANSIDLRRQHIDAFAAQMNIDLGFARLTRDLALQVYEGLVRQTLMNPGEAIPNERELLAHAAYLCEVGKEISYPRYHKHSSYMITNSGIMGFTQFEKQMIGYILRFHRRSFASKSHIVGSPSLARHFRRINFLAGCVRIAIALNRSRQGRIKKIRVRRLKDRLVFRSPTRINPNLVVAEVYHANTELTNFAKVLESELAFTLEL